MFTNLFRYDRDEETESETKIRIPEDEYGNMESAGNIFRSPTNFGPLN